MSLALATEHPVKLPVIGSHRELWAQTIGCRVPRGSQSGRVDAVFEHACNVALYSGELVVVLGCRAGNVAHGIRLTHDYRFDQGLRRGMPVRLGPDRIAFGNGHLTVLLSAARIWTPALSPGMFEWSDHSRSALSQVRDLLRDYAASSGSEFLAVVLDLNRSETLLAAMVLGVLPRLAMASRSHDCNETLSLLSQLIGLGPGLTPAGDDFIIGWLAGLALSAKAPAQLSFLQAMCAGIENLTQATTSVSRAHLHDACAKMFSERLSDLCVAISKGEPTAMLESLVAAQVAVGASSGADAAAGLMFALPPCGPIESEFA